MFSFFHLLSELFSFLQGLILLHFRVFACITTVAVGCRELALISAAIAIPLPGLQSSFSTISSFSFIGKKME